VKPREPLQCWGCGENHDLRDLPHLRENPKSFHNLDNISIVEDMEKATTKIYNALEDLLDTTVTLRGGGESV
jgi:hypothetical protein